MRVVHLADGIDQPLEPVYTLLCRFFCACFPSFFAPFSKPFLYSLFSTVSPARFMCTGLCLLHRGGKLFRRVALGEGQLGGGLALSRFPAAGHFLRDCLHAIGGRALSRFHALRCITLERLHALRGGSPGGLHALCGRPFSGFHALCGSPFSGFHALCGDPFSGFPALRREAFRLVEASGRVSLDCFQTMGGVTFDRCQTFRCVTVGGLARLANSRGNGLDAFRLCGLAQVGHGTLQVLCCLMAEAVCEGVDSPLQFFFESHGGTGI